MTADVVFMFDIDNTLIDNDRIVVDLRRHLERELGVAGSARYGADFEGLRSELGYADYLGALQRYRLDVEGDSGDDERLLLTSSFLVDYPFAERLYPRAIEVIDHLGAFGPTVILSDGDVVFQPRKAQRSGLWDAVDGRVLIFIHKERILDAVQRRYPARHYIMVDDNLRILAAMKRDLRERLTTVFPPRSRTVIHPAVRARTRLRHAAQAGRDQRQCEGRHLNRGEGQP
jgi:FMN phosphatase YigB (HAD superfamily)